MSNLCTECGFPIHVRSKNQFVCWDCEQDKSIREGSEFLTSKCCGRQSKLMFYDPRTGKSRYHCPGCNKEFKGPFK